ncbi:MAG: ribonuclease III [Bdellovibrionales bacterium]
MAENRLKPDIQELANRLEHVFTSPQLLEEALTHPSLAGFKQRRNGAMPYERMEFLGDRVLGLVIAEWLYRRYPDAKEGELAMRHTALVNRNALQAVALEIGLGKHVRLARGDELTGERKDISTLSDAMEAVIGAIYLDGGLKPAQDFIHRYWQKDVAIEIAPADPKTALQEWAQGRGLPLPDYRDIRHYGPAHAPRFVIAAHVKGFPAAEAEGETKRSAQKAAAALLLQQLEGIGKP